MTEFLFLMQRYFSAYENLLQSPYKKEINQEVRLWQKKIFMKIPERMGFSCIKTWRQSKVHEKLLSFAKFSSNSHWVFSNVFCIIRQVKAKIFDTEEERYEKIRKSKRTSDTGDFLQLLRKEDPDRKRHRPGRGFPWTGTVVIFFEK